MGKSISLPTSDNNVFFNTTILLHAKSPSMAFCKRTIRSQWLRASIFKPCSTRWQSSLAHLQQEMPLRKIQPIFDDLSPQQSYRLDMSLADYLPATK